MKPVGPCRLYSYRSEFWHEIDLTRIALERTAANGDFSMKCLSFSSWKQGVRNLCGPPTFTLGLNSRWLKCCLLRFVETVGCLSGTYMFLAHVKRGKHVEKQMARQFAFLFSYGNYNYFLKYFIILKYIKMIFFNFLKLFLKLTHQNNLIYI
jgi:hypothetical protein